MNADASPASAGLFGWWRDGTPEGRRALVAAALGWMLDAFDVMLCALVLTDLMRHFALSPPAAGLLGSVALLASAAGGIGFGVIADRFGRTRALMRQHPRLLGVHVPRAASSQTVWQLALFRIGLGLGMGGEWASGAALVSETWSARDRGKALGLMQSAWAIGYGAAAAVTGFVLPRWGWRCGVLRRRAAGAAARCGSAAASRSRRSGATRRAGLGPGHRLALARSSPAGVCASRSSSR